MTLYALDNIDDTIAATKAFLWPFDLRQWAKLAIVVFFLGGASGFNPLQFGGGSSGGDVPETPGTPGTPELSDGISAIGGTELALIVAIVAFVVTVVLVFLVVGSIMEFVFVDSLRKERVTIRRYWRNYWGPGLRLFGFRFVIGVITFGLIGLLVVAVLSPVLFDRGDISLALLMLGIPAGIFLAIVGGLINGFTTMFVVPIMLVEERGVLSGWNRFWSTLTGQWKQYVAYAIVAFVLQIAGGIAASIATVIGALGIAIPLGIIGALGVGLLEVSQIAGWAVITIAILIFVLGLLGIVLFTAVPVQTFLRYYALLVLGDTNDDFDVISQRREAIRG